MAALIGAASALLVSLIKDWFLEIRKERRAVRRTETEIYDQYLAPLCEACAKIVWRSHEIFIDERHAFLKTSTLPLGFNSYKRTSTLYRVATLVGWIRGMDRELSALSRRNPARSPAIAAAVTAFGTALAEGASVEQERLVRLCDIWSLDVSLLTDPARAKLAMRVEIKAHELAGIAAAADLAAVADLGPDRQVTLCLGLSTFVAAALNCPPPPVELVASSVRDVLDSLVFREALIYRDWQDALGDAMIERDEASARRFRIIGYAAFETLLQKLETPWMTVLAASIEDIDLDQPDPKDFRTHQLKRLSRAAAAILVAASRHPDAPVAPAALKAAKDLLSALPDT
ncbi:hypothetical protein [Sphingomonas sp. TREG-RG-20F-R18-01]|uniref:hypothetical protein n=1 Tax=Sphingomonas sp. TREG-RG-20F-R18-01 TaxID=2914982 RepID=UPI001F55B8FB|nr:hypothetical protein [Sphingomonas sp. TREG-RG-20F-R18-01]